MKIGSFIDDQISTFDLKPCTGRNRSQTWNNEQEHWDTNCGLAEGIN